VTSARKSGAFLLQEEESLRVSKTTNEALNPKRINGQKWMGNPKSKRTNGNNI